METPISSPEALVHLLFSGEAQQIYHTIQYEADLCLSTLQRSEQNKEIDTNKIQSLRRQIKDNLEESSTLRFTLNATDKKIQLEQNTNPVCKQINGLLKESEKENTLENTIDCLITLEGRNTSSSESGPYTILRNLISDSLRHRIKMAWCFDEILDAHRNAQIANMINVAHRLTEVALLLQDSHAIQEVRAMLKSLNLDVPAKVRIPTAHSSPQELKKILQDGIASMQKTHEDIQRLDQQRKEMKKAVKRLNEKLGEDTNDTSLRAQIPLSTPTDPKIPSKGMVFPRIRRR